uniref:NADH-ubiquinone oxidoreductase chain 4L n=1 Tax=Lumbriclymenella robusta TaxID=3138170 RepID=A0AB38ZFZ0_9ANNE
MTLYLYMISGSVALSLLTLMHQRKSLLMSLLSLEAMILTLVLYCGLTVATSYQVEPHTCLIMLILGACEASLGLALLVSLMRMHGKEMIEVTIASKC